MNVSMRLCGAAAFGLFLTACSNDPYTPIVDGQKQTDFNSDLTACRQVALQEQKTNKSATAGAVIGGLVGAADADDGDELTGAVAGAVIGGLIGGADEKNDVRQARDKIVFHCMRGRGHNVVG